MIIYSVRCGLRVVEVPIQVHGRTHGTSMYSTARALIYPIKTLVAVVILLFLSKKNTVSDA